MVIKFCLIQLDLMVGRVQDAGMRSTMTSHIIVGYSAKLYVRNQMLDSRICLCGVW